ncbi:MAG: hypothetical protein IT292_05460 [Deltaproteobacteria bacterium]|nr:hypothetical protein [Deltaproteobacteria bacterium]
MVALLCSYSADPNITDKNGKIPLYYAVEMLDRTSVAKLFQCPIPISLMTDDRQNSPLYRLITVNSSEADVIFLFMVSKLSDINIKDEQG